jgi:hypothetical protein
MRFLHLMYAGAVMISFALLGRLLVFHEALPHTHVDHVDSSLHKMLRSQRRLEDKLERLAGALDRLQQQASGASATSDASRQSGQAGRIDAQSERPHRVAPEQPQPQQQQVSASASCPDRKPFHTLMTSQASPYQQWQSRIAYFHWKKQAAAAGECTDMVGFHRLAATPGGKADGLEGEIPTIFTVQLSDEVVNAHFGFGVLNRPNSVKQLLASPEMRAKLVAPFVLIMETDHVLMRPMPNLATASAPAGWDFGYMHAHAAQDRIIQKYWPEGDYSKLDPVGPSPVLIHLDQLEKLTPRWLDFSFGLRSNSEAESVMQGWVQEMWGYSIAAASVGIKHSVLRDMQVEASSLTRHVDEDFHQKSYIFHYTYGIEYTLKGLPQGVNQIGEWSLDKRHYGSDHPPRNLAPPPKGANAAAYWLLNAWNEASAGIPTWPESKSMGTIGWRRVKATAKQRGSHAAARAVAGTRWTWGQDERGITFHADGRLTTPWDPKGTWGIIKSADEGPEDGISRCTGCLFADFANANHNLRFDLERDPPTFAAVRVGDFAKVDGKKIEAAIEA